MKAFGSSIHKDEIDRDKLIGAEIFNRDDFELLGWKKKLVVRKNDIVFPSTDEVM